MYLKDYNKKKSSSLPISNLMIRNLSIFRLIFGLMNEINTYLRLKLVWRAGIKAGITKKICLV